MRGAALAVAAWAACACSATPLASAATQAAATPICPAWAADPDTRVARLEQRLVELVNESRRTSGAPPVALEPRLTGAARGHARRMARLRTMAHVTDGASAEDRLRAADVHDWDAVGENIAQGKSVNYVAQNDDGQHRTVACHDADSLARDIFRAWYASPGHRETLLDRRFTHVGSGAAYEPAGETVYVTHDFARLVTCGYAGAPCCPPPAGIAGGICQRPNHCRAGTCLPEPTPTPSP